MAERERTAPESDSGDVVVSWGPPGTSPSSDGPNRSTASVRRCTATSPATSPMVPCSCSTATSLTLAEGQGLATAGFSRADLEGKRVHEVLPPVTPTIVEPAYRAALQGRASTLEAPYRDRFYTVQFTPVRDEHGTIVGGMVVAQDITPQKRAERTRVAFFELDAASAPP